MNSQVKNNDKVQSGQDMSSPNMVNEKHTKTTVQRVGRWYFGGVASAMAACCTHPLDLVKVHLQTISTQKESLSMSSTFVRVLKKEGVFGLYNGISASLLRQLTYSTARFGVYESAKSYILTSGKQMDLALEGDRTWPNILYKFQWAFTCLSSFVLWVPCGGWCLCNYLIEHL